MKIATAISFILFCTGLPYTVKNVNAASSDSASKPNILTELKQHYYDSIDISILPDTLGDTNIGPGRFVAIGNVTVRANATTTLAGRTELLFEPGRCLIVEGTLLAHNTSAGKIMLSHTPLSERANKIPIADSLWGGIFLHAGSSIFLNRTYLANANTGITIGTGVKQIDLACVDMSRGIPVPVVVNDDTVAVSNISCVSTVDLPRKPVARPLFRTVAAEDNAAVDQAPPTRAVLRIGSCVLTAGGFGATAFGVYRYHKYGRLYEESTDPSHHSTAEVDRYKDKATSGGWVGLAGGIASIIGSALFTYTIVF